MDWQIETVQAFVVAQKRERFVEAVSSEKRRGKFIASLAHFEDFDPRWIVRIGPSLQNTADICAELQKRGASQACQVMSELGALDRKELPLLEALREVIGRGMGTLICCIPGRLAYFENEDDRFILERTKG